MTLVFYILLLYNNKKSIGEICL